MPNASLYLNETITKHLTEKVRWGDSVADQLVCLGRNLCVVGSDPTTVWNVFHHSSTLLSFEEYLAHFDYRFAQMRSLNNNVYLLFVFGNTIKPPIPTTYIDWPLPYIDQLFTEFIEQYLFCILVNSVNGPLGFTSVNGLFKEVILYITADMTSTAKPSNWVSTVMATDGKTVTQLAGQFNNGQ